MASKQHFSFTSKLTYIHTLFLSYGRFCMLKWTFEYYVSVLIVPTNTEARTEKVVDNGLKMVNEIET